MNCECLTFHVQVSQSQHYPVDLYYLMDLSNSMSDDKDNIVRLGEDLATAIETITQDYTIGFGSFVDKELSPYISLIDEENCQQASKKCPPPYRYNLACKYLCGSINIMLAQIEFFNFDKILIKVIRGDRAIKSHQPQPSHQSIYKLLKCHILSTKHSDPFSDCSWKTVCSPYSEMGWVH